MTGDCAPNPDGSCSICGDVALPGSVITVDDTDKTARVRLADGTATVALDLLDDVVPGDSVMVHLGFAIERLERAG
ncbi:MAG TPA: HypC/HybG/HupF family hydrogenase formation chaperone [Gemmatimonadaceae bacterium]|nr:HypC/HybG/HupF family hydrogenase formation chaperone [Gemmatimonadaceae bacterium]